MATSKKTAHEGGDLPTPQACYDVTLSILGYRDREGWAAVALEMDLWGHGATFEEAVEDVWGLVRFQIGFAHFKDQPDMIWRPAEPIWFHRFADVRRARMEALIREQKSPADEVYDIAGLPLPPAHVSESLRFELLPAEA